ncbi:MAG TPA: cupin domain-containing protein [Pseudonocardia sp.]|jgi:mannose-6-phosphate isomerase-like protein (cupin superfamily)|nr:cupin domain-containing protein [Pseudonocardia sp.]
MSGASTRSGESGVGNDALEAVVVRADQAEELVGPTIRIRLLADSSSTGGDLSTQRVTMGVGADGATPHLHRLSSELFYVLNGSVDVLTGDRVITGTEGDLVVVPPGMPHAFAATPGHPADLLIVLTPGVERFEYFRHLGRIATGAATAESLLDLQDRYDTQFLVSPPWRAARAKPTTP